MNDFDDYPYDPDESSPYDDLQKRIKRLEDENAMLISGYNKLLECVDRVLRALQAVDIIQIEG